MDSSFILILAIAFAVLALPLLWLIGTYNGFVRLRNHCRESWSDIDTELKRRHDLIPNLVETVKGYAAHERETLERVIAARDRAGAPHDRVREQAGDESALVREVGHLMAVAEGYPQLKADRNFLQLQHELVNTEDRIQAARRFYNANVRDLNNRIEMFPSSLVAGSMNLETWDYFEIADLAVRVAPKVDVSGE
ncbi:MAG: LemA family protein [Verrucomicrobiae bacterium]|nr:LemA family protein [Verrucomicrobiae bacterium]